MSVIINGTTGITTPAEILSGGTINGVLYLDSSKNAASGSALTFDGTNLTVPAEVYRSSDTSYLRLAGGNPASNGATVLMFGGTHATNPGRLALGSSGTSSTSFIDFTAGGSEQMRLTSTGLGIGTSSPQFKLNSVQGSGSAAPSVTSSIQVYCKGYGGSAQQYAGIGFAMYEHTNGYWGSGILARDDTGSYGSALAFYTSTGSATPTPTERMRIDSSGNVGIGNTTPSSYGLLSVFSATAGAAKINIFDNSASASAAPLLQFGLNSSNGFVTSDAARVWTTSPSSTTASLNFAAYNGGAPSTAQMTLTGGNLTVGTDAITNVMIYANAANGKLRIGQTASNQYTDIYRDSASGYTIYNAAQTTFRGHVWQLGGVEAMRLDASGNLLVGTTSNTANCGVVVQCNNGVRSGISTQTNITTPNGSMYFLNPNGIVGNIITTGTSTVYNTSSDERLKTNVKPSGSAIQSILDFPVDQFDWLADGSHQDFGAVAQKAIKHIPEMVAIPANEDEMWGIDWSKAVPRLIKTIQELEARLAALEGAK